MEKLGLVPILSWRENLSGRVTKAKVTSVEERREKKKISAKKRGCERDANRGGGWWSGNKRLCQGAENTKVGRCSAAKCSALQCEYLYMYKSMY